MSYLEASKALYESSLRAHFGCAQGCSEATISQLERDFGAPFPAAYREFLAWLGEHVNGPFRGSDCFPCHLPSINKWLPELLAKNQTQRALPTRVFTFFMHQGCIAACFELPASSDDSPVWIFREGEMSQPEQRQAFSEWLFDYLREVATVVSR